MRRFAIVGLLVVSGSLHGAAPGGAANCSVPGGYATLSGALADPTCTVITLAPGTYVGPFPAIDRGLDIVGAGSGMSVLQGNGSQPVLTIQTSGSVGLWGLAITGGGGTAGGGIRSQANSNVTLKGSVIRQNSTTGFGAGIFHGSGTMSIIDSTISGNTASGSTGGGGIYNAGTLIVQGSTISGNSAGSSGGGGISNDNAGAVALLTNVTISGNTTSGPGGGFSTGVDTTATLTNVTIVGNRADTDASGFDNGGGINSAGAAGALRVKNSIVADNFDASSSADHPDCTGVVQRQGWVLIGAQTSLCTFAPGDDATGYRTNVGAGVAPLAQNGGPTATHALRPTSAAVNSGGACGSLDQRGFPRKSGSCDRGAYELLRCLGGSVNRLGTSGADVLVGTAASDVFLLLGGDDVARGGGGADRMCGGDGNDRLLGEGGNDRIAGQNGRDRLSGNDGRDHLDGGAHGDVCRGGRGRDTFRRCDAVTG